MPTEQQAFPNAGSVNDVSGHYTPPKEGMTLRQYVIIEMAKSSFMQQSIITPNDIKLILANAERLLEVL